MIPAQTSCTGRTALAAALLSLALLPGCGGGNGGGMGGVMQTDTGKGALFGGMGGAALGAIIDHGNPWAGALIGAVGGSLSGALVGHFMDDRKKNLEQVLQPEINAGTASVTMLKDNSLLISMTRESAFQRGSTVVNPAFISTLNKVAGVVKTYGKTTISVIGHPDSGGSEAERRWISDQRAEAVRGQLLGMGVPPAAVSASGSPSSSYLDGRVELVLHPVRESA
jgi:outer membrane protein OmpA-like peptidoglycan-associated protein